MRGFEVKVRVRTALKAQFLRKKADNLPIMFRGWGVLGSISMNKIYSTLKLFTTEYYFIQVYAICLYIVKLIADLNFNV